MNIKDKKRYQFVNSNWHLAKKFSEYRFWEMMCSTNLTLWQAHNYTLLSRTVWWNHVQRSKLCYAANLMAMKFKYMCATIKIPLKFSIWQLCLPKEAFHRSWKYFCVVCSVQYGKILFSRDYANWINVDLKPKRTSAIAKNVTYFSACHNWILKSFMKNRYYCTCSLHTKKLTSVQELVILLIHTTLCK